MRWSAWERPASGPPPMLGEHETVVFAAYDVVKGTGEDGG